MPQVSHVTKLFGVNDGAVYALSGDVAGAAPTYGSKVDVTGIQSADGKMETDTKELRGDNTLLAADSVLRRITGTLHFAKLNYDIWKTVTNALTTDAGTSPNTTSTLTITQNTLPAFFKFEGQSKQVDAVAGDVHIQIWKCMPGALPLGFAEEDYMKFSLDFTAVPVLGTITGGPANAWLTFVSNETAALIT